MKRQSDAIFAVLFSRAIRRATGGLVAALCLSIGVPFKQVFAQINEARKWSDLSGKFSVDAEVQSLTPKEVTLKKADGKTVTLPRGKLSKEDRDFLTAYETVKTIGEQAKKIEPHLQKLRMEPQVAIDAIQAIQKAESRDPCAMLWCGVAYASEGGKQGLNRAQQFHDDAIARLRMIHKHLPLEQPRTLVSALNNRAILSLREREATRATALFKEIATVEPELPFFVSHNIQVLLDVTLENKFLELANAERRALSELNAKAAPNAAPVNLPRRFVYSTDFSSNERAPAKRRTTAYCSCASNSSGQNSLALSVQVRVSWTA